ncbi:MAG: hypothetical protein K2H12_04910, partial [Acetatifactor sp.]|nr:hypothetical protein [Acetatifactor sp.]
DIAFRRFHFLPQDTRLYRNIARYMAGRRIRKASAENSRAEETAQEIREAQAESTAGTESAAPESGRRKKPSGKKAVKQEPQTLDTSALLKKRDQRNQ